MLNGLPVSLRFFDPLSGLIDTLADVADDPDGGSPVEMDSNGFLPGGTGGGAIGGTKRVGVVSMVTDLGGLIFSFGGGSVTWVMGKEGLADAGP
jgi:hypothetical protein